MAQISKNKKVEHAKLIVLTAHYCRACLTAPTLLFIFLLVNEDLQLVPS